jgi:hypothetical protein
MSEHNTLLDNFVGFGMHGELLSNQDEYSSLFDDRFKLNDLNITARVLLHWKGKGLLPDKNYDIEKEATSSGKMSINKFNFFELIYLYILQDLREIGYSINKLQKVKEALLKKVDFLDSLLNITKDDISVMQKEGAETRVLEEVLKHRQVIQDNIEALPEKLRYTTHICNIILTVLVQKLDVRLIVSIDGDVTVENPNSLGLIEKTSHNTKPRVVLPLLHYLNRFLSNNKYSELYVSYKLLDQQEKAILDHVRKGQYKEIKIKFNKKNSIILELTEECKVDNAARLQEILLNGAYQDLQLKTQRGIITYSTIKTKMQL